MSAAGIGKPRRHFAIRNIDSNGRGPVLGLGVGHERKWRDLARTMARLAMLLKDGKNILVEGWRRLAGVQDVGQRNQDNPA
jgi:hypothetical protein